MKKFTKILVAMAVGMFLFVGATSAKMLVPADSAQPGYEWTTQEYWTPTDFLPGNVSLDTNFALTFENGAKEAAFGLYTVDSLGNVDNTFEIFAANEEPASGGFLNDKSVHFQNVGGAWQVSTDTVNWTDFDLTFGFYYEVFKSNGTWLATYNTGADDSYKNATWENTLGQGGIAIQYDDVNHDAYIQLSYNGIDFDRMTIAANDVKPSTVPEPATMLLLGSGLLGLLGFRKKSKK
jgi:hypothetical protein